MTHPLLIKYNQPGWCKNRLYARRKSTWVVSNFRNDIQRRVIEAGRLFKRMDSWNADNQLYLSPLENINWINLQTINLKKKTERGLTSQLFHLLWELL